MGTNPERPQANMPERTPGRVVGISGTFNVIHRGHEALLKAAFGNGELVLIGLSTDDFASSTRDGTVNIKLFEKRRRALKDFLNTFLPARNRKYSITPLGDSYGPAIEMKDFHALVVSPETEGVGEKINAIRKERGLAALDIILVPHVPAEDGLPISATRVLRKEIDRDGKLNYVFSEKGVRDRKESLAGTAVPSRSPVLVHACCAGCLLNISETLGQEEEKEYQLIAYWYNPNIHPAKEYVKRREAMISLCRQHRIPLVLSGDYRIEEFFQCTLLWEMMEKKDGEGTEPEGRHLRCEECYRLRLGRTAELARHLGIRHITTTLLSSPYQDHQLIQGVGETVAARTDAVFLYLDFRKGFKLYNEEYGKTGLYHQNYCGCLFSERERVYKDTSP